MVKTRVTDRGIICEPGDGFETGVEALIARLCGVDTLADGATPALDASKGSLFNLSATDDRTIAVPSNPPPNNIKQTITIAHYASGGARTLSLNTGTNGFAFTADIASLTQTASGKTDYISCIWNSSMSKWIVLAYTKGA